MGVNGAAINPSKCAVFISVILRQLVKIDKHQNFTEIKVFYLLGRGTQ